MLKKIKISNLKDLRDQISERSQANLKMVLRLISEISEQVLRFPEINLGRTSHESRVKPKIFTTETRRRGENLLIWCHLEAALSRRSILGFGMPRARQSKIPLYNVHSPQQPQKRRLLGTPTHDVHPTFRFNGLRHEHVTFPHIHDVHARQGLTQNEKNRKRSSRSSLNVLFHELRR
jgi:hypothetical protein